MKCLNQIYEYATLPCTAFGFQETIAEDKVVGSLPPKENSLELMAITKVLSQKGTNSLGYWEVRYQYDPKAIEAEQR